MRYLLMLLLFTSCEGVIKSEVSGTTTHRIVVGIDSEGLKDLFEGQCRTECDETLPPKVSDKLFEQCVEACIAEQGQSFLDMIGGLDEQ